MSISGKKTAQLKAYKKLVNKSLQYLTNEAYRILENPVILFNTELVLLAHSEDVTTDDPIWNHHVQRGTIEVYINRLISTDIRMIRDQAPFMEKIYYG